MKSTYTNPKTRERYQSFLNSLGDIPIYYSYGGKAYKGFAHENIRQIGKNFNKQDGKECTVYDFLLDNTIKITLISSFYSEYGAYEWTVYFENISDCNSKILENVKLSMQFEGKNPILRGIYGDHEKSYEPYCFDLSAEDVHFRSDSGRATHVNFPYFNLEYGSGGSMLAIGWAGTWRADFEICENTVHYNAASVNNLCTYLKAGEKIRTALFVVADYSVRDEQYATNYWRSWFVEHNLPKADKENTHLSPFSTCCLCHDTGLPNSDGSISERYNTWRPSLEKMIAEDVKVDFRWFDAGWYITPYLGSAKSYVPGEDWWDVVGTWELDPQKWPNKTFLESTEFARQNGMKTLMWFEPERVTYPDDLSKNFGYNRRWAIECPQTAVISNNIGDEECRKWTTERICKTLRENKVEMYREDNNCDPSILWKYMDEIEGENRSGITECKFIDGHYKMWDDIISCTLSYGGCGFVDSCASGGGRNDIESMRRGVPILRSDSDRTSASLRLSMTSTFNKWIPFCGANTKEKINQLDPTGISDKYVWRASYLAVLNVDSQFVQSQDQDFSILRFGLKEWKKISPYLLGEFYTMTPWHSQNDKSGFTSFAYYDSKTENGVILAFCQEECQERELAIKLPFVTNGRKYTLNDEDNGNSFELCTDTLSIRFSAAREAKLLWIKAD